MIFLNILILLIVFITSSLLSGFLLRQFGYPPPRKLENRQDYLLFAMKIITFMIIALLFMALLMLLGIDPLQLMENR